MQKVRRLVVSLPMSTYEVMKTIPPRYCQEVVVMMVFAQVCDFSRYLICSGSCRNYLSV